MSVSPKSPRGRACFAAVEPPQFSPLERAMGGHGVALQLCTQAQLLQILTRNKPGNLIIDPGVFTDAEFNRVGNCLQDFPRVIVLYTPLTIPAVARTIALARKTVATVVLQALNGGAAMAATAVLGMPAPELVKSFLAYMAPQLRSLPPSVRFAIENAFADVTRRNTAANLALGTGLTRRSFDRWLVRAGIPAPRLLLAARDTLRAIGLLVEMDYTIQAVATFAGFRSARQLEMHCYAFVGLSAAKLREPEVAEYAVRRIADTVLAGEPFVDETADAEATLVANRVSSRKSRHM